MKKKPTPPKSANDWLADIMDACGPSGRVDQVPEGWLSVAQMSEITQTPGSTVNHRMIRLLRAKKVQRKKFRVTTGSMTLGVWHYYKADQ